MTDRRDQVRTLAASIVADAAADGAPMTDELAEAAVARAEEILGPTTDEPADDPVAGRFDEPGFFADDPDSRTDDPNCVLKR